MPSLWFIHINTPNMKFLDSEYHFIFEDKKVRLIRGTVEESDKILFLSDESNEQANNESINFAHRLVDYLSWEHNSGIKIIGMTARGFNPEVEDFDKVLVASFHARNVRGLLAQPTRIPIVNNVQQRFAMNLWNEALCSNSPFFSFLNYWNILEITLPNSNVSGVAHRSRIINWINGLSTNRVMGLSELKNNIKNKYNSELDVGTFLYNEGRNAISHLTRRRPILRYEVEDRWKIGELNVVMKAISAKYIKEELGIGTYSHPLEVTKIKKKTNALSLLKKIKF